MKKKVLLCGILAAAMLAAGHAHAAISAIEIAAGDTAPLAAGRAIAFQAISTNKTGTVAVKKVTPLEVEWFAEAVVTNFTYRPATSNVLYTATETLWSAYTTNAYAVATGSVVAVSFVTNVATVVTGTVWSASTGLSNLTHTVTNVVALTNAVPLVRTGVTSNLIAQAWGAKPFVASWPTNELLYTSQSVVRTLSSNLTYQVVDTRSVETQRTRHVSRIAVTNTLIGSMSLSGGWKTNAIDAVIFPGEYLVGEGTALTGGRAVILIER
jgi:hypothetical protein